MARTHKDKRFKLYPDKFWCSVETDVGPYLFNHSFDNERDARIYCKVLREAIPSIGQTVYTVALMKAGHVIDVWDGKDWVSDIAERMYAPINAPRHAFRLGKGFDPEPVRPQFSTDDERDY